MTTPIRTSVQLHDAGELIAAIPHLLGFHPVDSLVVIAIRRDDKPFVTLTLRVDLPPPEQREAVARQLAFAVGARDPDAVVVVVVGGANTESPDRAVVDAVEEAFTAAGIPVAHVLHTPATSGGVRWRCYDDPECDGTVADTVASELAVATVTEGAVTFASRAELAALLTPADDAVLARRTRLLDSVADRAEPPDAVAKRAALALVRGAIDDLDRDRLVLGDHEAVALAVALSDHHVRDTCLLPAEDRAAAEKLWILLTTQLPAPERAEPACLLAFAAYLRGDGALASIAVTCAEQADPGHVLTGLLRDVLVFGLPPDQLRQLAERAVGAAEAVLGGEGAP